MGIPILPVTQTVLHRLVVTSVCTLWLMSIQTYRQNRFSAPCYLAGKSFECHGCSGSTEGKSNPVAALVSLSKIINHNCLVLRMGRKAVCPVGCVMHVKEPRTLIVKNKGLASVFLDSRLEHPAGWICARYKSSVLLLLLYANQIHRRKWTRNRGRPLVDGCLTGAHTP